MLIHILENRFTQTNGTGTCDDKLESSLLYFLRAFKKNFALDGIHGPVGMANLSAGLSISHPLLSVHGSNNYSSGSKVEEDKKEIDNIYDAMGIGDNTFIMNMVVNKICSNIKYWYRNDTILGESLDVFIELVSSYNSSKTLLNLDTIKFLVSNHTGSYFPFLGYDSDNKYRINFYSALSRLVFSSSEDVDNQFDLFIVPNLQIIEQLSQAENLRTDSIKVACIGMLRDLRGIVSSTYNKRTYNIFFDSIYPLAFPLFTRIAETWYDEPNTMTALFKFFEQLVFNKGQRINFEQSSPNGILLFRECSNIICAYGSRILQVPVQRDIYTEKYKGIRLMLNTLTCALSGSYVNFGVFGLYNDTSLQNSFDVCLQLCLQIPLTDVLEYVKLSKAYFGFLEILFRNHLEVLSGLDSSIFIQLVQANLSGLQSNDVTVSAICASSVDHVATYIFLNMNKSKSTVHKVRLHLSSDPDLLFTLTSQLFNTLLFTSHTNQWAITRPILSLLLASEASFNQYQTELISKLLFYLYSNFNELKHKFIFYL
jgi:exportin-7